MDPAGEAPEDSVWMLSSDCAEVTISERPLLSKEALSSLESWISSQLDSKDHVHDNLPETSVDGCKGGLREAAEVLGGRDPRRETSLRFQVSFSYRDCMLIM